MALNVLYRGFLKLMGCAGEHTKAQLTGANINKQIRVVSCFGFFLKEAMNEGRALRAVFHSLFLYVGFSIFLSSE